MGCCYCCSVGKSCPILCDLMDSSTPGFPVLHHLLELLKLMSIELSRWCHLTISSSVAPFSSCLQCFPASGSFPMSWLFASGGQSIEASASVLPMNIQGWFPLGLSSLISLQFKGLSRVFSQFKSISSSVLSLLYGGTIIVPILQKRNPGTRRFLTSPMPPLFLDTPDLSTQLFVLLDLKSTTTTRKHKHFQGFSCMIKKSRMKTMIMTSLANKLQYQCELSELRNKHLHDWQSQARRQLLMKVMVFEFCVIIP